MELQKQTHLNIEKLFTIPFSTMTNIVYVTHPLQQHPDWILLI